MVAIAAAAFRDDVLFVQYSNPSNNFGTLYAIYLHQAQDPPNGSGEATMYSTQGNSTNSATNTLIFSAQTILGRNIGSGINSGSNNFPVRSSMVSTSSMDASLQGVRHDLLLLFSFADATTTPMIRLVPQPPYNGDGDVQYGGTTWTYVSETQNEVFVSKNVTGLWVVSGDSSGSMTSPSSSSMQEGSAIYELYTDESGVYVVQKIDVSSETGMTSPISHILWTQPAETLDGAATPMLARFLDGGAYDGVVVGGCSAFPQQTCLVFFNDAGTVFVSTTTPFESTSCLAADGGSIVMVTSTKTWTFNYDAVTQSTVMGTWMAQMTTGTQPTEGSSILACTARDQTFYTIQKGEGGMPSISTLDFSNTTSWTWQSTNLVQTFNARGGTGGSGGHKRVSTPVIVTIVIVFGAIVGAAVYLWLRKTKPKSFGFNHSTTVAPRMLLAAAPINNNNNNNNNNNTPYTPYTAAVTMPYQTVNQELHSGGGSNVAGPPAGIPIITAYTNITSFPLQPTGAVTSDSPTGAAWPGYHAVSISEQRLPFIATSLSAAPYRPFVISSAPLPSSPVISLPIVMTQGQAPGDKPDRQQGEISIRWSGEYGESLGSSSSLQRSSEILYADGPSRPHRNSRPFPEILSPTLASAQLILQQSQQPKQQ